MITVNDINDAYALLEKWQRTHAQDVQKRVDADVHLEVVRGAKLIAGEIVGKNEAERAAFARQLLSDLYDELERAQRDEAQSKLEVTIAKQYVDRLDAILRLMDISTRGAGQTPF